LWSQHRPLDTFSGSETCKNRNDRLSFEKKICKLQKIIFAYFGPNIWTFWNGKFALVAKNDNLFVKGLSMGEIHRIRINDTLKKWHCQHT
jgi:hypothetical protein